MPGRGIALGNAKQRHGTLVPDCARIQPRAGLGAGRDAFPLPEPRWGGERRAGSGAGPELLPG